MASVDVVCVTYSSAGDLADVLRSAPSIGRGQTVVVDHGDDGSDELAREAGAIVVRDGSNPGFGSGQNRGVALGSSEYVLLLNPDCLMRTGAVQVGVAYLDGHPGAAAVQGVIASSASGEAERSQGLEVRPVHLWGRALGLRRLLSVRPIRAMAHRISAVADHVDRIPAGPISVESLAATALLVRRRAFEEVGGFDPRYFLYGEDLDLCHRLRTAGWSLVALPIAWGDHVGGASSGDSFQRELVWWEGTMLFAAGWWGTPAFTSAVLAAILRSLRLSRASPSRLATVARRLVVAPVRRFCER